MGGETFTKVLNEIGSQVHAKGFDHATSPLLESHHGSGESIISLLEMVFDLVGEAGHEIVNEK